MIAAELLALVGLLMGGGIGVTAILAWANGSSHRQRAEQAKADERARTLELALKSRDHRQLDDWLLVHGDEVSKDLRKHIELRRDELYIDSNP